MPARPLHAAARRLVTGGLTAVMTASLVAIPSAAVPGLTAAPAATTKIEPAVAAQLGDEASTTFWVTLASQADLPDAGGTAAEVFEAKTEHAEQTQAGLRALLTERGVNFTPYWMDNSVEVTGDAGLAEELAARPEVAGIEADDRIELPPALTRDTAVAPAIADWNLHAINAPRVWNELGTRGEGVVVASIDSGVRFDHPGLIDAYRGRAEDGTIDHDYNFFDTTNACREGTTCDAGGHGTHTMGTMIGRERALEFGVAPGAKWIAVKGCVMEGCSRGDLLAAGQWILAPTDSNGENPRPDLAPDIVNNSWGGDGENAWYDETVRAWVAAGIFPAFAAGNTGPNCGTAQNPGRGMDSYATGATGSDGTIAEFSSRGPGTDGVTKPDLVAPGVRIRSAFYRDDGFVYSSGTSMASPHTAGTVALMWSHSPGIHGDIAATRAALDGTATDVEDLSCGGTAADNNVYGEGRLDAYAAATANPPGAIGALGGTVSSGGAGLSGVAVTVSGPQTRRIATDPTGRFTLPRLLAGDYTVRAQLFGYHVATGTVTVSEGGTATSDLTLTLRPHATVSGTVRTNSGPLAAARVVATGTPVTATTDAEGRYTMRLPVGEREEFEVRADNATDRCTLPATEPLRLAGDTTVDLALPDRTDGYGHQCAPATGDWVGGTERLAVGGGGNTYHQRVELPFPVVHYGATYDSVSVYNSGFLGFGAQVGLSNARAAGTLPSAWEPNTALYPAWGFWTYDGRSGVHTAVTGAAPNRVFVVEWRDLLGANQARGSFAALLGEDGTVTYRYRGNLFDDPAPARVVGMEDAGGTTAFQYAAADTALRDGLAITFRPGATGVARGLVTDGNDGLPVAGATATLRRDGTVVATGVTRQGGGYAFQVPPGDYEVTVASTGYEPVTNQVTVAAGEARHQPVALRTARIGTESDTVWVVPPGEDRQRTVELTNTGTLATDYTVSERTDVPWLSVANGVGTLAPDQGATLPLSLDAEGLPPGTVHRTELVITSDSGRAPDLAVPVTLVVPAHQFAIDAGERRAVVDSLGDTWQADRAYETGSYGHVDTSRTRTTNRTITGTTDQQRFRTLREGMHSYRFDGLTAGTYTVELDFAELTRARRGDRVFDLLVNGVEVLAALDVADRVGDNAALSLNYTATVTDGSLEVEFASIAGYDPAIVNAIRVTHRPDLP